MAPKNVTLHNPQTGEKLEYLWDDADGPFDYTSPKAIRIQGKDPNEIPPPPDISAEHLLGSGLKYAGSKLGAGVGAVVQGVGAVDKAIAGTAGSIYGSAMQGRLPEWGMIKKEWDPDTLLKSAGQTLNVDAQGNPISELDQFQTGAPTTRSAHDLGSVATGGIRGALQTGANVVMGADPFAGQKAGGVIGDPPEVLSAESERAFSTANPISTSAEGLATGALELGTGMVDPGVMEALQLGKVEGMRKLFAKGLGAAFGAQGGVEGIQGLKELEERWDELTPGERAKLFSQAMGGLTMAGLMAKTNVDEYKARQRAGDRAFNAEQESVRQILDEPIKPGEPDFSEDFSPETGRVPVPDGLKPENFVDPRRLPEPPKGPDDASIAALLEKEIGEADFKTELERAKLDDWVRDKEGNDAWLQEYMKSKRKPLPETPEELSLDSTEGSVLSAARLSPESHQRIQNIAQMFIDKNSPEWKARGIDVEGVKVEVDPGGEGAGFLPKSRKIRIGGKYLDQILAKSGPEGLANELVHLMTHEPAHAGLEAGSATEHTRRGLAEDPNTGELVGEARLTPAPNEDVVDLGSISSSQLKRFIPEDAVAFDAKGVRHNRANQEKFEQALEPAFAGNRQIIRDVAGDSLGNMQKAFRQILEENKGGQEGGRTLPPVPSEPQMRLDEIEAPPPNKIPPPPEEVRPLPKPSPEEGKPFLKDPNRGLVDSAIGLIKAGFVGNPKTAVRNGVSSALDLAGQLVASPVAARELKKLQAKAIKEEDYNLAARYEGDMEFQKERAKIWKTPLGELSKSFLDEAYNIGTGGAKSSAHGNRVAAFSRALDATGHKTLAKRASSEAIPGEAVRTRAEEISMAPTLLVDKLVTGAVLEAELRAFSRKWGIKTEGADWDKAFLERYKAAKPEDQVSMSTDLVTAHSAAARTAWNMGAPVKLKMNDKGEPVIETGGIVKELTHGKIGQMTAIMGEYFMNSRLSNMLPAVLESFPGLQYGSSRFRNSINHERLRQEHLEMVRNVRALEDKLGKQKAANSSQKEITKTEAAIERVQKSVKSREKLMTQVRDNGIYRPEDMKKQAFVGPLALLVGMGLYFSRDNEEDKKLKVDERRAKNGNVVSWGSIGGFYDPFLSGGYNIARAMEESKKFDMEDKDKITRGQIAADILSRAGGNRYGQDSPFMIILRSKVPGYGVPLSPAKEESVWSQLAESQGEAITKGGFPGAMAREFAPNPDQKTYGIESEDFYSKQLPSQFVGGALSNLPGESKLPSAQDFSRGVPYKQESYGTALAAAAKHLGDGDLGSAALRVLGATEKTDPPIVKLLRDNRNILRPSDLFPEMMRDKKFDDIRAKIWAENHLEELTKELQENLKNGPEGRANMQKLLQETGKRHKILSMREALDEYERKYPDLPLPLTVKRELKAFEGKSRLRISGPPSPYLGRSSEDK